MENSDKRQLGPRLVYRDSLQTFRGPAGKGLKPLLSLGVCHKSEEQKVLLGGGLLVKAEEAALTRVWTAGGPLAAIPCLRTSCSSPWFNILASAQRPAPHEVSSQG